MKLLQDVALTHSIEVNASAEDVFDFLVNLVDDETYRAWHPEDHVALRWIKGEPWKEGSVVYAEEYIHGKLHKLKFLVAKVVPNREIQFCPASRLLRIYFPMNAFLIEPKGDSCVFTATGRLRVGRLARALASKKLETGIASARKHMKEEGENLKRILEGRGH